MFTCRETRLIHEEENLFLLFYLQLQCIDSYIGTGTYTPLHFMYTYIGTFLVAQMDTGLQGNQSGYENVSTAKVFQDSGRETELTVELAVDDVKFSKGSLVFTIAWFSQGSEEGEEEEEEGESKADDPYAHLSKKEKKKLKKQVRPWVLSSQRREKFLF